MKAAFVGLVGRPSAGKSTLLNRLCGHKISIISPVPQTTRNRVRGICNAAEGQLVFIATPGFHLSERKMNLHLTELVSRTLEEAELVLYLVDSTRPAGEEERALMALLEPHAETTVVALNKVLTMGAGLGDVMYELAALLILSVVYFAVGVWLFSRTHLRAD